MRQRCSRYVGRSSTGALREAARGSAAGGAPSEPPERRRPVASPPWDVLPRCDARDAWRQLAPAMYVPTPHWRSLRPLRAHARARVPQRASSQRGSLRPSTGANGAAPGGGPWSLAWSRSVPWSATSGQRQPPVLPRGARDDVIHTTTSRRHRARLARRGRQMRSPAAQRARQKKASTTTGSSPGASGSRRPRHHTSMPLPSARTRRRKKCLKPG